MWLLLLLLLLLLLRWWWPRDCVCVYSVEVRSCRSVTDACDEAVWVGHPHKHHHTHHHHNHHQQRYQLVGCFLFCVCGLFYEALDNSLIYPHSAGVCETPALRELHQLWSCEKAQHLELVVVASKK